MNQYERSLKALDEHLSEFTSSEDFLDHFIDITGAIHMKYNTKLIFASGVKGEFGLSGKLPWGQPLEEDMTFFKEFTEGTTLLMGRSTWESLPCKLRGLKHVVLSSALENFDKDIQIRLGRPDQVYTNKTLEEAVEAAKEEYKQDVTIIGGKDLIERGMFIADKVSWTLVRNPEEGLFPHDVRLNRQTLAYTLRDRADPETFKTYDFDTCSIGQGDLA